MGKTMKTTMPSKLHGQTVEHMDALSTDALTALKANPDLLALLDYNVRRADWQPVYGPAQAVADHTRTTLAATGEPAAGELGEQDRLDLEAGLEYINGIEDGNAKATPNSNAFKLIRDLLEGALGQTSEQVLSARARRRSPILVQLDQKLKAGNPWGEGTYQRPGSDKLTALQVRPVAPDSPWSEKNYQRKE